MDSSKGEEGKEGEERLCGRQLSEVGGWADGKLCNEVISITLEVECWLREKLQ